jgi:hypothetical protein
LEAIEGDPELLQAVATAAVRRKTPAKLKGR